MRWATEKSALGDLEAGFEERTGKQATETLASYTHMTSGLITCRALGMVLGTDCNLPLLVCICENQLRFQSAKCQGQTKAR